MSDTNLNKNNRTSEQQEYRDNLASELKTKRSEDEIGELLADEKLSREQETYQYITAKYGFTIKALDELLANKGMYENVYNNFADFTQIDNDELYNHLSAKGEFNLIIGNIEHFKDIDTTKLIDNAIEGNGSRALLANIDKLGNINQLELAKKINEKGDKGSLFVLSKYLDQVESSVIYNLVTENGTDDTEMVTIYNSLKSVKGLSFENAKHLIEHGVATTVLENITSFDAKDYENIFLEIIKLKHYRLIEKVLKKFHTYNEKHDEVYKNVDLNVIIAEIIEVGMSYELNNNLVRVRPDSISLETAKAIVTIAETKPNGNEKNCGVKLIKLVTEFDNSFLERLFAINPNKSTPYYSDYYPDLAESVINNIGKCNGGISTNVAKKLIEYGYAKELDESGIAILQ